MARTEEGRAIYLLTISSHEGKQDLLERDQLNDSLLNSEYTHSFRKSKMIVMFSARVHPGESPSSHVFDSIVSTLLDKKNPTS